MKEKIIFSCVVIVIILLISIITGKIQDIFIKTFDPGYTIIKDKILLYKDKDGWQETSLDSNDAKKAYKKKYFVYTTSTHFNGYIDYQNNNWFSVVKDKGTIIKGFRLATLKNNISPAQYKTYEGTDDDDELVTDIINEIGGNFNKQYRYNKIIYDLDNDGIDENVYFVTNITLDPDSYIPQSVIFVEKNNKTTIIDKAHIYKFDIEEVIDLDNDNHYELIVSKSKKTSNTEYTTCFQIYSLKDNKWQKIKKCKV